MRRLCPAVGVEIIRIPGPMMLLFKRTDFKDFEKENRKFHLYCSGQTVQSTTWKRTPKTVACSRKRVCVCCDRGVPCAETIPAWAAPYRAGGSLQRSRKPESGRALCFVSLQGDLLRHPERRCSPAFCNIEGKQAMVNPGGSSQPPPVSAGSLSWKRCAGCGGKIADRFLLYAMDSYWHSRCLKCSCCQAQLGDIGTSCYTKSGMILCRNDYIRLFGTSGACSACGQSIPASELVMRAQGNVYHLKCFTCSTCRNRLVPGDRFHYINGSLFCEHDRPTALINGHLNSLQSNPLLPDQKVC
ncbi:LIM domain transcription factor LMO4 isoform A [Patagioenas fasciata monilis]|uniref:LIM domain transcription factor LMO4 isoform A n=1 Tax=Patagioenas fasciata monilis TaxID=372326 RepID=A0A1V4JYR7_PATFA|nr:LIM domain transcription factor LMO4 isoform A [Patagioenas fasciata monilis]